MAEDMVSLEIVVRKVYKRHKGTWHIGDDLLLDLNMAGRTYAICENPQTSVCYSNKDK